LQTISTQVFSSLYPWDEFNPDPFCFFSPDPSPLIPKGDPDTLTLLL